MLPDELILFLAYLKFSTQSAIALLYYYNGPILARDTSHSLLLPHSVTGKAPSFKQETNWCSSTIAICQDIWYNQNTSREDKFKDTLMFLHLGMSGFDR